MTLENLALFKAVGSKMDYLNQRQRVIAQNIANTDTPNYRPQDLVPVDFGRVLEKVTKTNNVRLRADDELHLPRPNEVADPREDEQDGFYEVAPAGNAVIMEEQLINAGKNQADYNLMTNLMTKHIGMLETAIGRGQNGQ